MFSLDDIVNEIDLRKSAAKADKIVASWDRLRAVATDLAGVRSASDLWSTAGDTWTIESVSIMGYRGIGNEDPLELGFDPRPGITVLHGLNGAGKSSISDAIEIGLTGKIPASTEGKAGRAALWDPVHLARGAESARIEVTLVSDGNRLLLTTLVDSTGNVQTHEAELSSVAGKRKIALDSFWHDALASHQPVFAYASLERRVQLSKDLAEYFEGLLALGGSFTTLEMDIVERADRSKQAFDRWRSAKDDAMKYLSDIDEVHSSGGIENCLKPVREPLLSENPDEWLRDEGLLQDGTTLSPLPGDSRERLRKAALRARAAIDAFDETRMTSEQSLSTALELLHSEATGRCIDSGACPVCASPGMNWRKTLSATVARNRHVTKLQSTVQAETENLAEIAGDLLVSVVRVCEGTSPDDSIWPLKSTAKTLTTEFLRLRETSHPAQLSVLTATMALCSWLISKDAQVLIGEAVARSDATRQWNIARTKAVEAFVTVWRSDGAFAVESIGWTETKRRLEDLRRHLRKRRSVTLEGRAGSRIKDLLSDAGLRLEGISVQSSKATIELVDKDDNKIDLGMLSAGQRNAVLLAPLLASVDAGPFGFLVLDDPVHAFDELRIDRLAESLSQIASSRRIIVLTHDERLKEYLVARAVDYDTRLVGRTQSGAVEVSNSNQFWHELLTDAGHIHDLALKEVGHTKDVTDSLRRLCRMSLDNAIRAFILRNAVVSARDAADDLKTLDSKNKTEERLSQAESFWQGPMYTNPATQALRILGPYFVSWNHSVHGNPSICDFSRSEIKDARKVCKMLASAL